MARKKHHAGGKPPKPTDDHDRQLLANVESPGWHVIGVEEDEEGPSFAYSIGLSCNFQHAELILFGLPVRVMHLTINVLGDKIKSGEKFAHLDESGDVLEGYTVCFRAVERKHYRDYLGYARWFYRGDEFLVLQCVWPDAGHRYPWHREAAPAFVRRQPVLSPDATWPFHEGKNRATFTTRRVLDDNLPILLVSHDDDGGWQFLCGTTTRTKDAKIVSLGCMFERDQSLAEVADLPEGWTASRPAIGAAWNRAKTGGS
jgi:hypothetical protein